MGAQGVETMTRLAREIQTVTVPELLGLTGGAALPMVRPPFGRARSSGVEHLTFNQRVDGSIPSGLTNRFGNIVKSA